MQHTSDRWANVITLGNARFGQLHGGPFDGRCYPLGDGTPDVLHVPVEGMYRPGTAPRTLRYVLRNGIYRFASEGAEIASAA